MEVAFRRLLGELIVFSNISATRPWESPGAADLHNRLKTKLMCVQSKVSADGLVKDLHTRLSKIMSQKQLYSFHEFSTKYCLLYCLCGAAGIPASSVLGLLAHTSVFHLLRGHPGAGNKQLPRDCSLDCPCSILVSKCNGSLIILVALNKLRMGKPIKCCIPLNLIEALSNTLVVLRFHPDYLNI